MHYGLAATIDRFPLSRHGWLFGYGIGSEGTQGCFDIASQNFGRAMHTSFFLSTNTSTYLYPMPNTAMVEASDRFQICGLEPHYWQSSILFVVLTPWLAPRDDEPTGKYLYLFMISM